MLESCACLKGLPMNAIRSLSYPVRLFPVMKYFGLLSIALALMTLVPATASLLFGDYRVSFRYGVIVAAALGLGAGLNRLPSPKKLQGNEAMVITAMIFLFAPLAMSWPMMASGIGFLDALFEAISAVTTTGLSTVATLSDKPETFLFARAWMQWLGGLGIVVLSLTVMIQPGLVAKRLGDLEDYDEDLVGGTRAHARRVLTCYSVMTAVGVIALGLTGIGWLNAVLYCFAAVSTGGFSPNASSLSGMNSPAAQAIVTLLSVAGGISLVFYHQIAHRGWGVVKDDRQLHGYITAGLVTVVVLALFLWRQSGLAWDQALIHGALNGLSAQSTAGFSSLKISDIDAGSKLVLMMSMFVGGGAGSTAGGVKILRLLILARLLQLTVQRAGMPRNAVATARLGGRRIQANEIQNALSLVLVYVVFIGVSWLPFAAMGQNPFDSLFEVVSAIGTVGLSAGIASPALDPLLKVVLCVNMLLGRLEILAWLVLLSPGTWIGNRLED